MTPSKSINYFIDDEENKKDITGTQGDRENILLFIAEKGVIYPTEIARACDLNIELVNRLLFELKRKSYVKKVVPPMHPTQEEAPLFLGIISEMNERGVIGHASFLNFSWWTLTFEGLVHIHVKYRGQHKPIRASLVHQIEIDEGIKLDG